MTDKLLSMWVSTTKLAKIEGVTGQTIRRKIEGGFYDKVKQTDGAHNRIFINNGGQSALESYKFECYSDQNINHIEPVDVI